MEKGRPVPDEEPKLGGFTRLKEDKEERFFPRMPTRLCLVGDRPAGAELAPLVMLRAKALGVDNDLSKSGDVGVVDWSLRAGHGAFGMTFTLSFLDGVSPVPLEPLYT